MLLSFFYESLLISLSSVYIYSFTISLASTLLFFLIFTNYKHTRALTHSRTSIPAAAHLTLYCIPLLFLLILTDNKHIHTGSLPPHASTPAASPATPQSPTASQCTPTTSVTRAGPDYCWRPGRGSSPCWSRPECASASPCSEPSSCCSRRCPATTCWGWTRAPLAYLREKGE